MSAGGWTLPSVGQQKTYAHRLARDANGRQAAIAAMAADAAHATGRRQERRLLAELERYLRGLMTMQNVTSNAVYVASLAVQELGASGLSFADIVVDHHRYFHPYGSGGGWPKTPPNYLSFRYLGRLQQIRHVEGYDIVADPTATASPAWSSSTATWTSSTSRTSCTGSARPSRPARRSRPAACTATRACGRRLTCCSPRRPSRRRATSRNGACSAPVWPDLPSRTSGRAVKR